MPENPKESLEILRRMAANPQLPSTTMIAEKSRFDDEAGFGINPFPTSGRENIDALNEARAQSQSTLDRWSLFVPRVLNKFVSEVASVPGYVGGAIMAMGDQTIGEAMDNAWLNNIQEFSEELNEDLFKVYVPESVKTGGLMANLGSASFWATEGADGVGFLTSMLVPGNVLKALKVGKGLQAGLGKVGKFTREQAKLAKLGNKIQDAALWAGNNYDDVQAAALNTVIESSAEARESFTNVLDSKIQQYMKLTGLQNPDDIGDDTMQRLRKESGEAASSVFKANMGLLFASNLIDQANLFGAFGTKKSLASKIFDEGKLRPKAEIIQSLKTGYKDVLGSAAKGFGKEGFLEEGPQFAFGEFYKDQALGTDKYDTILEAYIENLDNPDMQKAIALGGILGSPMSVVGEINENKRTKEAILGGEDITRNKFQKALGMKDRKGSFGLYDLFNINLAERTQGITDAIETVDGQIQYNEDGSVKYNEEKLAKVFEEVAKKQTVSTMMDLAAAVGNKDQYNLLKGFFNYNYFKPFFEQGSEGLDILKQHIKNELVPMEAAKNEKEASLKVDNKKQISEIERNLLDQVDEFYQIYDFNARKHSLNFPASKLKGGDQTSLDEFSSEVASKKIQYALNESSLNKDIKELQNELLTNKRETEEDIKKAEETENKLKQLAESKEKTAALYKEQYDPKALQVKYNEFLENKKAKAEVKAEAEATGKLDPNADEATVEKDYLDRLREAGYDVDNPNRGEARQPIYFTFKGKGYIAMQKQGEVNKSIYDAQEEGKLVGTFNMEFYKKNRDAIKFISPEDANAARKKRKIRERKMNQITALVKIATETKTQYENTLQEIEDKNFRVMELLEDLEQQQKSLKEIVDSIGRAKKGKKVEKETITKNIEALEKQIQAIQEEVDNLEAIKVSLSEKLEVVEVYKNEIESLTPEEGFSFISELSTLEGKETTMEAELITTSTILEQIRKILTQTDEEIGTLKDKQKSLENLIQVYKDIQSISEANQLLLLADSKEEAYKQLIQKYPFLNKYKVRQFGFLQKVVGKVKGFDSYQDFLQNKDFKKELYKDIETFVNQTNSIYAANGMSGISKQDIINSIVEQLTEVSSIDNQVKDLENYIAQVEELKNEIPLLEKELQDINNALKAAESKYETYFKDYSNITDIENKVQFREKSLRVLKELVNDLAVNISKINVEKGKVDRANMAPINQQPPVQETDGKITFADPYLTNFIFRSIMNEVKYTSEGKTEFDSKGNPVITSERWANVISDFMNSNKTELRDSKYKVQFYSVTSDKTPKDLKDLFSTTYTPEEGDIAFVILDENYQPVKHTFEGVSSTVYGFLPKSVTDNAGNLRINNNALVKAYIKAVTDYDVNYTFLEEAPQTKEGYLGQGWLKDKLGNLTKEELIAKATEWIKPHYEEVRKTILAATEQGDTFSDIVSVTQGVTLFQKSQPDNSHIKKLPAIYGQGTVKVITIADSKSPVLGNYQPGSVVYEKDGEFYPVEQRQLTPSEVVTALYAIYKGWEDNSQGNFKGQTGKFGIANDGKNKFMLSKGVRLEEYRWYPGGKTSASVLGSLIYWGQFYASNPVDANGKIRFSDHKGEIFVKNNMLFFKNPNNNWEVASVSVDSIRQAFSTPTPTLSPELKDLVALLSTKNLNVNKDLLDSKTAFFYPQAQFNQQKGTWELAYKQFTNYQSFLVNGGEGVPNALFTTASRKNTGNRILVFNSDAKGNPVLYSEKKTFVKQTNTKAEDVVKEVKKEVVKQSPDIEVLNNTAIADLPDGKYTLEGTFKGQPITREFIMKSGVMEASLENSVNAGFLESRNSFNQETLNSVYEGLLEKDPNAALVKISKYESFDKPVVSEPVVETKSISDIDKKANIESNQPSTSVVEIDSGTVLPQGVIESAPASDFEITDDKAAKYAAIQARLASKKSGRNNYSGASRVTRKPVYKQADVKQETQWLKDTLGLTDKEILIVNGLVSEGSFGKFMEDGKIILDNLMEVGTAYHEAFHRVFRMYLSTKERQALISEFKQRPNWESLLMDEYKDLSIDEQIEEVIAEEFREYVLSGGNKISPKKKSFFDRLIDFIKSMLGMNASTKEELFQKINSGYYKNAPIKYSTVKSANKIVRLGDIELTPSEKSEAISYMNLQFFNRLFDVENADSSNYTAKSLEVKDLIYTDIKESLLEELNDSYIANVEEGNNKEAGRLLDILLNVEDHYSELVKEFAKNLETFNLKVNFEASENNNISSKEEYDVVNGITEDNQTGKTLDLISSVEFNTKDLMPNNIKMLIGSLSRVSSKGDPIYSYALNLPQQADWGQSINLLLNNIAGTPANIDLMLDKITELSVKNPEFQRLIKYLGGHQADFKGKNDLNKVMLRAEFVQTFAKTKYNFVMQLVESDGNAYIINSNQEQLAQRKLSDIINNAKSKFSEINNADKYLNSISVLLEAVNPEKNLVAISELLGFNLTAEQVLTSSNLLEEFKAIYSVLKAEIKSSGTFKGESFDNFYKKQVKGRTDKLIKQIYKAEESFELQFMNTEGKMVYSVSLNTYQTLIVDAINYWVGRANADIKTNNREGRLKFLEENVPHLINVSTVNSKWLDNILDTGAELVYNLSDGINFKDSDRVHLSEVTETDLTAFMFTSTIMSPKGFNVSMKHSDRSMFPTYSWSNDYMIVDDSGNPITKGVDVMIGYLKDEVNKLRNLKENTDVKAVKYYNKAYTEFEKRSIFGFLPKSLINTLIETNDFNNADVVKLITNKLQEIVNKDINKFKSFKLDAAYKDRKHIGMSNELVKKYGTLENALTVASLNNLFNHIEETKLFVGDLAGYKNAADLFKRLNMQSSTGNNMVVYDEINNFISDLYKNNPVTIDGEKVIYKNGKADGEIVELTIKDFNVISSVINEIESAIKNSLLARGMSEEQAAEQTAFFTKAYRSYVENDGISYANIFSLSEYSIRSANWTIGHKNNFDLQLAYLNGDLEKVRQLTTVPNSSSPVSYFKNTFEAFTSKKPQYVGPNYLMPKEDYMALDREDRHNIIAGRKTAYFPMIPTEIQGTILETMQTFMIKNGIDFLHMDGAAKFGIKESRDFYASNVDGTTGFFSEDIKDKELGYLDYKYMKDQVKISNKSKVNISSSTQGRKNNVEGFYNEGVPLDFKGTNWDSLSEQEKENASRVHKLLNTYQKLQYTIIDKSIKALLKELDAVESNNEIVIKNTDKFKALLSKVAVDKNSAENIIDAIEDFLTSTKYFELLPNSEKIQNIIHSMVTNRVLSEKRPGDMVPQMAVSGMESKDTKRQIIKVKGEDVLVSDSKTLKFFTFEEDKTTGEIIKVIPPEVKLQLPVEWLPMLFAKYSDKLGADGRNIMKIVDAFNKDLLSGDAIVKVKGLRIPNQQFSSNDIFKVKSFGYPFLQGFALVPSEIVAKTGGDFDIDKVSIYFPNYNEKGEYVQYDNSKSIEENSLEALQNKMLEVEEEMLLHPLQISNMLSPVSDDELEKLASDYRNKMDSISGLIDVLTTSYNIEATMRFLAGKAGVGQMATWITFNAISQLHNLQLNKEYTDSYGNVSKTILPNYLAEKEDYSLGRSYDFNLNSIANALSAILTSQVDLVKDPYAEAMTLINQTLNPISYLLLRGVPLKEVITFVNQPSILEYLKAQRFNESFAVESTGRQGDYNKQGLKVSKSKLMADHLDKHTGDQRTYLSDFLDIVEQAKAIGKVKNYLSPDTKFMKDKNTTKDFIKLVGEVKGQNIVANVDQAIAKDTLLGGFAKGRDLYYNLFKDFYITELPGVQEYLDVLKSNITGNLKGDNKAKAATVVDMSFVTYLLQTKHPELKGRYDLLLKGKNSVGKRILKYTNNPKSPLYNNMLLKNMLVILDNKGLDNVRLFKSKMVTFENNLMLDTFNEVALLDAQLAKEIILLNMYQAGLSNSPYQLQRVIPYNISSVFQFKDLVASVQDILANVKDRSSVMNDFYHKFLLSHLQYLPNNRTKNYPNNQWSPYYTKRVEGELRVFNMKTNQEVNKLGDVFSTNYNIPVETTEVIQKNNDEVIYDNNQSVKVQPEFKQEIIEAIKALSEDKKQQAIDILRNTQVKTVEDKNEFLKKLCNL